MIFNLVIDRLFAKLSTEVGIRFGDFCLNAMSFADDLVLFATTANGLQSMLDITSRYLLSCGLNTNASKCFTVSLKNAPGEKKLSTPIKNLCAKGIRSLPSRELTNEDI